MSKRTFKTSPAIINNNPEITVIINPTKENPKNLRAVLFINALFICNCSIKLCFRLMNKENIFSNMNCGLHFNTNRNH